MHARSRWFQFGATAFVLLLLSGGGVYAMVAHAPYGLTGPAQHHPPNPLGLANPRTGTDKGTPTTTETNNPTENQTNTHNGNHTNTHSNNGTENQSTSFSTTNSHNGTESEHSGNSSTTTRITESHSENESSTSTGSHTNENETSSSSNSTESGGLHNETQSQHELKFRMVPASANATGQGEANIGVSGTNLEVRLELQHLSPNSTFTLQLVINGSETALGNFTTSGEGVGTIDAQYTIKAGNWAVGLRIYELHPPGPIQLDLVSQPGTLSLMALQSQSSTTTSEGESSHQATAVSGGPQQEDDIQKAIGDKTIPAVIDVGRNGLNVSVLDSSFTVFVGKLQGGGLQITISATNVTTPRVLFVNLTSSEYINIQSGSFKISFDGTTVQEAGSVNQVLSPTPGGLPMFVLISAASGYELLISIPHFSTHVIQILPSIAAAIGALIAVDGPVLLVSALAVTFLFLGAYARRTRVFE